MNLFEFLNAFHHSTLTKKEWTHEAHIKMAWLYLRILPDWTTVLPLVRNKIQALNSKINMGEGYHETITASFLRIVKERLLKLNYNVSWQEFIDKNPDLINAKTALLLNYYSSSLLFSEKAKTNFIEPDLKDLP